MVEGSGASGGLLTSSAAVHCEMPPRSSELDSSFRVSSKLNNSSDSNPICYCKQDLINVAWHYKLVKQKGQWDLVGNGIYDECLSVVLGKG